MLRGRKHQRAYDMTWSFFAVDVEVSTNPWENTMTPRPAIGSIRKFRSYCYHALALLGALAACPPGPWLGVGVDERVHAISWGLFFFISSVNALVSR